MQLDIKNNSQYLWIRRLRRKMLALIWEIGNTGIAIIQINQKRRNLGFIENFFNLLYILLYYSDNIKMLCFNGKRKKNNRIFAEEQLSNNKVIDTPNSIEEAYKKMSSV